MRRSLTLAHLPIYLVLIAYLSLSLFYSFNSPLYEPTDELRHFRYVRHIAVYHSLPVQSAEGPRAQSHHPPLYYALGALVSGWVGVAQEVYYEPLINLHWDERVWEVSNDNKNQYLHSDDVGQLGKLPHLSGITLAVYLVRWMTVLIGAGVVWLTYLVGRELFPDHPALAVGGAALVGFNPQFLYLSGAVNNDIPAALCGAAVLLMCVRLARRGPGPRTDAALGLLYGLALLTKLHLAALLALIELAYLLALWRTRNWRAFLRGNLIVLGLAAAISGWWFGRNLALYGDLTGMSKVNELWAGRSPAGNWWAVWQGLPYLWSSLWGRFGYGQLPLPQMVYQVIFYLGALALAGYLTPRRGPLPRTGLALSLTLCLIFLAVVVYYILIQPAGAMGRFLFPALPAFAVLLMGGLSRFFPRRLVWAASLAMTVGMAALAVYGLVGVLAPAFGRPRPLTESEIEAVPNPTDVEFGGLARLLGYRVAPTEIEPGGTLEVTLYWQALARPDQNYVVFAHLLSDVGTMVAQRDTHPGLGRYPTTAWEPGVAFADTYRLHVPQAAYAPDEGYVQVGLYLPGGPRLVTSDGVASLPPIEEGGRDALRLAEVEIRPLPGQFPNPVDVNFGGQIVLAGYDLDRRVARPGETIRLTLYWQTLAAMEHDYRAFAHLLGVEDQVWANSDSQLTDGTAPTSHWRPGQIVQDVRELTVGLTTPPGFYDVEVGLYTDRDRLPVLAEDGHWLGDRALLSKIRVVSEYRSTE